MLLQQFIRASAIYCRRHQPAADIIVPFFVRESDSDVVSRSNIKAVIFEIKLHGSTIKESDRNNWIKNIQLSGIFAFPLVTVCINLGPVVGPDADGSGSFGMDAEEPSAKTAKVEFRVEYSARRSLRGAAFGPKGDCKPEVKEREAK
jgi:hypothetical protein